MKTVDINAIGEQILNHWSLTDAKQIALEVCTEYAKLLDENNRLTAGNERLELLTERLAGGERISFRTEWMDELKAYRATGLNPNSIKHLTAECEKAWAQVHEELGNEKRLEAKRDAAISDLLKLMKSPGIPFIACSVCIKENDCVESAKRGELGECAPEWRGLQDGKVKGG